MSKPWRAVEVLRVIRTKLSQRGAGTEDDVSRLVTEYWTMDGELLFLDDEYAQCLHCGKRNRDPKITITHHPSLKENR